MIPRRVNNVPVKIKLISRRNRLGEESAMSVTLLDTDFRQPKGKKIKGYMDGIEDMLETSAQIVFNKTEKEFRTETGDASQSDGHLCFRKTSYDALEYSLVKGDVIVEISGRAVSYSIIEIRPSGHLKGKSNLILCYFINSNKKLTGGVR